MNKFKFKIDKTVFSIAAMLLMGAATLINNKLAEDSMKEAVAEEVQRQLENIQ